MVRLYGIACLAAIIFGQQVVADSNNGQVELIFPQNATYQPTPLMPVVFSIQNPKLVNQLYPSLEFSIFKTGDNASSSIGNQLPIRRLNPENATSFLYQGVANLADVEGEFELAWKLRWINCSRSTDGSDYDHAETSEDEDGFHRRTYWPRTTLSFSTAKNGKAVDLENLDCKASSSTQQGFAFHAKDHLQVPLALAADGVTSCVLLASPAPTAGPPCQATVNSDIASSISASLTKAECGQPTPAVSCPAEDNAGHHTTISSFGLMASLAYMLISVL